MAGFSDYAEQATLNCWFRNTAITPPANLYVALFTADPVDTGTANEVSTTGTAYARQAIATATGFNAPVIDGTGYKITNANDITFPVATATWNTITHFGLFDAPTGGNFITGGALSVSKLVNTSDQYKILAGKLTVSID